MEPQSEQPIFRDTRSESQRLWRRSCWRGWKRGSWGVLWGEKREGWPKDETPSSAAFCQSAFIDKSFIKRFAREAESLRDTVAAVSQTGTTMFFFFLKGQSAILITVGVFSVLFICWFPPFAVVSLLGQTGSLHSFVFCCVSVFKLE